jgi:hypothetical protein
MEALPCRVEERFPVGRYVGRERVALHRRDHLLPDSDVQDEDFAAVDIAELVTGG